MTSEIKKYQFKKGLPMEFEIISVADLYSKSREIVSKPHRSNFYHIIWVKQGNITHFVDFNPIHIQPNALLFIPRDFVHVFDTQNSYEGQIILFTDDFFCFSADDGKFLNSTILFNDLLSITKINISSDTHPIIKFFDLLLTEYNKPFDSLQHAVLKNLLHGFLLIAERERRTQDFQEIKPSHDLEIVLQFKKLLEQDYKSNKFVYHYAKEIGATTKRLTRATFEILSKTPKQMIDERVLLESKRLLVHTSMNVKEISMHLGFEEPTNFNKFFKNISGITPVDFRNTNS